MVIIGRLSQGHQAQRQMKPGSHMELPTNVMGVISEAACREVIRHISDNKLLVSLAQVNMDL